MNDPPKVRLTIFQVHLQHGTQLLVRSQHTWKVAKILFKMAFIMNKLAMINSCEIILEE